MNRRETIKGLALSFGYVVAAPTVVSVLESCSARSETWPAIYFDKKEQHFVTHLVDIILPATDTPGGLDVNLPQFIDMMSHDMFRPEEKNIFKEGSEIFANRFKEKFGNNIGESGKDEIAELFASYFDLEPEEQNKVGYLQSKPIEEVPMEEVDNYKMYKFLFNIRSLALFGYFTSEKVGKEVLNFDPIPGRYVPCVPVSEIGNAWTI
jgi:hypothetical protein